MLDVLGYIYREIVKARVWLYGRRVLDVHDLGARTISVGNLTTGGTGKTPLVGYIARLLIDRGEKVCILTRGYGREDPKRRVLVSDGEDICEADPTFAGDEPLELANKLQGKAVIVADADRVGAAEWAKRKFAVTVFILDDGFQHLQVRRQLDIVCVDATNPFGGGKMLPAGRLREPVEGLARADAVVITRKDLVSDAALSDLRSEISEVSSAPVFAARSRISDFKEIHAETERPPSSEETFFAFCGLGNPESFFEGLRREGLQVKGVRAFEDHHQYSQKEIVKLESEAAAADCAALITSAKDAVKLAEIAFAMPCVVAEIEIEIDEEGRFSELILSQ
jgi:tetraacyldisaccharide 4'-kinase